MDSKDMNMLKDRGDTLNSYDDNDAIVEDSTVILDGSEMETTNNDHSLMDEKKRNGKKIQRKNKFLPVLSSSYKESPGTISKKLHSTRNK